MHSCIIPWLCGTPAPADRGRQSESRASGVIRPAVAIRPAVQSGHQCSLVSGAIRPAVQRRRIKVTPADALMAASQILSN